MKLLGREMIFLDVLRKKAKKVNVAVTNRCNLRCHICGIWKKDSTRELSLKTYEDFFKKHNWHWVAFTGGEPFLRKDFLDLMKLPLKYCRNLDTISIVTNGYLTERIVFTISKMLEEEIKSLYVSVSLDGVKEFHDFQRGVQGSFDRAISTFYGLKDLNSKKLKVHFEYVISKLSQGKLMETIDSLGLTPNDFIVTVAQRSYFYGNEESANIEPDEPMLYQELTEFLKRYKVSSLYQIGQKIFLKYILENKRIPCVGGLNSFYMDAQGIVYPCIMMPNHLGNISEFQKLNAICRKKCYTPCEGYLSLFLGWRESFWMI